MGLDPRITFTRASVGTYYNAAGVLSTAASGAPRFDYHPITHAPLGLLIEEARSNGVTNSQDFTQAIWFKTGMTITADQTPAPDGTTTADLVTASASPATVDQGVGIIGGGTTYVTSIYAKKGTSNWFYLCAQITGTGAQTPKAYFNLATGAMGTVEALITAATMQDVGGGWYRCSVSTVATAGTERLQAGICNADASAVVTVGRTIYLWGAQSEIGAFQTSYFPATRAADVAVMTGTAFSSWYNQPAGTFVAEFDLLAASGTRGIMAADNNATAERIMLYGSGTDPKVTITDNSVVQADLDAGTVAAGTVYKLGVSFALNDVAVCLNGGTVGTDTAATMPTPTQLRLGVESATAANTLNGHLRRIRFYNVAKSDAALQALTT